jgi:hypothetical protein
MAGPMPAGWHDATSACARSPLLAADNFEQREVQFGSKVALPEVAKQHVITMSTTIVRNHDLAGAATNTSTSRTIELDGWRYFTAMPCASAERPAQLCLFFKDKALEEEWLGAVTSDDGLHFTDEPALVLPQRTTFGKNNRQSRLLTHNLALAFHRGQYYLVGGQDNKKLGRVNRGLWMAQARAAHIPASTSRGLIAWSVRGAAGPGLALHAGQEQQCAHPWRWRGGPLAVARRAQRAQRFAPGLHRGARLAAVPA